MDLGMPKECSPIISSSIPSKTTVGEMTSFEHLSTGRIDSIGCLESCLARAKAFRIKNKRPFITVSYAQSVDGSIAIKCGEPIGLSGPQSALLTHRIRACGDAVLIGDP